MSEQKDYAALREALAEYSHAAWSNWMRYMFKQGYFRAIELDGTVQMVWIMPAEQRLRWEREMHTRFSALSEDEKESVRFEADRIIEIMDRVPTVDGEAA